MTLRWRAAAVAGSVVLTLLTGFESWWQVRLWIPDFPVSSAEHFPASAWSVSSRWTGALITAAAAGALWLLWRVFRAPGPRIVRATALAAVAIALFLAADQAYDARARPGRDGSGTRATYDNPPSGPDPAREIAQDWMRRDHLTAYDGSGMHVGRDFGFWDGIVAMLCVALSVAALRPERSDDEGIRRSG